MKFNLSRIMHKAWALFKGGKVETFAEALHRAWISEKAQPVNAARIAEAQAAAGIVEECRTWSGWRDAGREVIHGSKALFGCDLIHGSKGDGAVYKARFFSLSQTQQITATA